jgi:hypothetical protein|tara:strand:- start:566 stop:673 length:108 start_codon:yes stop_codon:yes gene_type:complete
MITLLIALISVAILIYLIYNRIQEKENEDFEDRKN